MSAVQAIVDAAIDRGLVPEVALRAAIRAVCAARLRDERRGGVEAVAARQEALVQALRDAPIAIATEAANAQHYEVPPAFFARVLGPHRKYSSAYWPPGVRTLGEAEAAMLALVEARAGLADGQEILDLGCGWGAFALWAAARWPAARITAVSNAHAQRTYIYAEAAARGLRNLEVVTGDVRTLAPAAWARRFDRVVSVEMFEHVRNHRALLARIAGWLRADGALFVHVFAHRELAYLYEDRGPSDWMAREFFTGGMMPSATLLARFQDDLRLDATWLLDGTHYARTAQAWVDQLAAHRAEVTPLLGATPAEAARRYQRWRVFFLACVELFGYRGGREWVVAHHRFVPRC